jgi:glycosyltransferase involved in cell wall biosynthesis
MKEVPATPPGTSPADTLREAPFASADGPVLLPFGRLAVLIVNPTLPLFPGGGGVEYLTTTNMAALADRVGLVSMAHYREDLLKARSLTDAGVDLYLWTGGDGGLAAAAPRTFLQRCWHGVLRRLRPHLEALLHGFRAGPPRPGDTLLLDRCFRNMAPHVSKALADHPWQVLSVVESSAAATIDYLPRQLVSVLVMHDIRSVLYERRAQACSSRRERARLLREAARYRAFERHYCQRYDLVVTVSRHDEGWVRSHYRPARVITVPLPVDAGYFQPRLAADEAPHRILFTGLMNHPPNSDAAIFFARDVLPRVLAAVPEAAFHIVGRNPTPEVQALGKLPGVTVVGGVPDIRPWVASARVIVVPLRYGSGSRQKILEAWCMEKCVVSTRIGAEGLAYANGENLLLADSAEALADGVIRALTDAAFNDRLRHSGRAVAVSLHDPQRVAADYYGHLREVAAEKRLVGSGMRVAIDLRWMIPGRAGGLENLARSFLRHLLTLDRFNSYTVMLPARVRHDFDLRGHPNVRLVCADSLGAHATALRRRLWRWLHAKLQIDNWESNEVVRLRALRSLDAAIAYSFPGYLHPDLLPLRHVLMVPDIQHEYHPEFFDEKALAERRRLYGDSVRRADHICAISEFTRQTLIDKLGVPPDKVTTVLLAADPSYHAERHPVRDPLRLRKYGLEAGGYLFFPAHTWHHKNHKAAVAALRILRDKHRLTPQLVCSGAAREAQSLIEKQVEEAGLQNQVRFLGYCAQNDMPVFYRNAFCLLYPSLFEGFGMPVLEAMSSGCPVVCSNTSSLPEIAGDAALQADPHDHEGLADAVARLAPGSDLRGQLVRRGLAQAERFSWQRHTLETVAVFHRVHQQLLNP